MFLLQVLVQGVAAGMIYALVGVGFALVFRAAGLFNFAHTESYTIGALLTFTVVSKWGQPYGVSILLIGLVCGAFGVITELAAFRRLIVKNAPPVNVIVASIALGIILRALSLIIWGPDAQHVKGLEAKLNLGSVVIDGQNLVVTLTVILIIVGLGLLLYRTRLGIALRAVADNRIIAGVMGVDIRLTLPLAFGLAGVLGGMAGSLVAPILFSQFRMGQAVIIKAFSASVIGGLDNIPGTIVGGLFIGIIESLVGVYVTSSFKDVFSFALLIVMLVVRPTGILGRQRIEKV
jgi:branched-chain amino acid transport system permease protein